MKKIIVFLVVAGVCLGLGGSVLAKDYSKYVGTWRGKVVVYGTTCKSLYENGHTENYALKITKIKSNGNLKAVVLSDEPDYAKQLSGKIKGHHIRFHYTMWGRWTTYDFTGTVKGKKMTLRAFNNYPKLCEEGWHNKFNLEKK